MSDAEDPPPAPGEPVSPSPGDSEERPGNPWEQRDRLGILEALLAAVRLFVTSPGEAFARTRERGDLLSPLVFAILLDWLGVVAGQLWWLVLQSLVVGFLPVALRGRVGAMSESAGMLLAYVILAPFLVAIGVFVWSAVLHLSLMLVGGTGRSRAGFEGTLRAVSYSSVASLAHLVPLLGGLIALVWTVVLQAIGLARLHRTSEGRALVAILIPLLLCCACCAAGIVLALGAGLAAWGGKSPAW